MPLRNLPLLLSTLLGLASLQTAARGASFPSPTIPQWCGIQLKTGNASAPNLDQIQALGFKYVRRGFVWGDIEKSPGQYDFSGHDRLVDDCEKRGLSVLGCIALNNKAFPQVRTPAGREAFARFAARVVARYKGRPVIWEIWNEPNIATFWGHHGKANTDAFADEYSALVKAVAPAMRKADPGATIVAGSVNLYEASFKWMDRCFKNGVLASGIDGWSVHPYSTRSPEGHLVYYTRIRKLMAENGAPADFPLLDSERGYPIGKAEGYAGGDPALSAQYQARHFVRQYLCDALAGIRLTIWYEWSGTEGFGLKSGTVAMPAMTAARAMLAQLDGCTLVKRLPLASPSDYVLSFADASGGVKLVAWTSPPVGQSPDRTVIHDVSIPVEASGPFATADLYGKAGKIDARNGSLTLTLSGAPQYVTLRPSR